MRLASFRSPCTAYRWRRSSSGCWSGSGAFLLLLLVGLTSPGGAAEYVVGGGIEADTEDAFALSAFGSVGLGEETWLTVTAARSGSESGPADVGTVYADAGLDHWFEPLGVRVGGGYWGDADLLEARHGRASLYWKNEHGSLSLDYERRAFDLTIGGRLPDAERTVEFDADGFGASVRFDVHERVSVYARGMSYDYSRDIEAQPDTDRLRIFSSSRLSMMNSLLDSRLSGGVEVTFGTRLVDLQLASWRTAVFGDRVDSLGVGLLTPLGEVSDIELRLATDDSNVYGRATVLSVFVYFYGA